MRAALHVVVFGVGWLVATALVRPLLPDPDLAVLTIKLRQIAEARDRYTAIFTGSSRVYREVVPSVFEEEMAARGHDERMYNLGVFGMRVPESLFVIRKLVEMQPKRLRWMFVELQNFGTETDAANFMSDREVNWHETPETLVMTRAALAGRGPLLLRLIDIVDHWRHWLARASGMGRGLALLPPTPTGPRASEDRLKLVEARTEMLMARNQGWIPLESENAPVFQRRADEFLDQLEEYHASVAELKRKDPFNPGWEPHHQIVVDHIRQLVAQTGARLVFVVMPGMSPEQQFVEAHAEGLLGEMIAMNAPHRFPFLYREDQRYDMAHLKRAASQAFTKLFVRELDRLIAETGDGAGAPADEAGGDGAGEGGGGR